MSKSRAGDILVANLERLLEAERKKKGNRVTQEAIATAAGVDQSYISDLKRGRRKNPSLRVIEAIAGSLGVRLIDLLSDPKSRPRDPYEKFFPERRHANLHRALQAILQADSDETRTVESVIALAILKVTRDRGLLPGDTKKSHRGSGSDRAIRSAYRRLIEKGK